jgi:hypothetical protein
MKRFFITSDAVKDHCNGLPISISVPPAEHEIYGKSYCRNLYVSDRHCLTVAGVLHVTIHTYLGR